MAKLPSTPWPVRIVALVIGVLASLYILEVRSFGSRFGELMGAYLRTPAAKPAENGIPSLKGEPGTVPVTIISDKKPDGK
jgi:hypothetical protein